jgi:predicted phosphodiesterase
MRIAILSDIHGNLTALDAVLSDLRQQKPDVVYQGWRRSLWRVATG